MQLTDEEIISLLYNEPDKSENDDDSEEEYNIQDENLANNWFSVFNAVKILSNYMALKNVSSKTKLSNKNIIHNIMYYVLCIMFLY